ncbi:MAG: energy-coupling factor transporter transmembrane protein EcfT [Brockia lithotrophica]|nr:energy-coupling factor transporter transmembrane protein EcfT [Brockia lithotrophica]
MIREGRGVLRHPPYRVALVLFAAFLGVSVRTPVAGAALDVGAAFLLFAEVGRRGILQSARRLAVVLPWILFFFAFFPLLAATPAAGLAQAALYGTRLAFVALLLAWLFARTPLDEVFRVLSSWRVPDVFVLLLAYTVRYGEHLAEEAARMRLALRARGFREGRFFTVRATRTLARLLGALYWRTDARSRRTALALRARGFSGRFLGRPFPPPRPGEALRLVFFVALVLAVVLWDYAGSSVLALWRR